MRDEAAEAVTMAGMAKYGLALLAGIALGAWLVLILFQTKHAFHREGMPVPGAARMKAAMAHADRRIRGEGKK